jgi:hypothetical protein
MPARSRRAGHRAGHRLQVSAPLRSDGDLRGPVLTEISGVEYRYTERRPGVDAELIHVTPVLGTETGNTTGATGGAAAGVRRSPSWQQRRARWWACIRRWPNLWR